MQQSKDWQDAAARWRDYYFAALKAAALRAPEPPPVDLWREAALLKDRTRQAIRERITAGDPAHEVATEYHVPDAFVTHLCSWQLFGEEGAPEPPPWHPETKK